MPNKEKISITLDKEILELIENLVRDKKGLFRNRSHVVEYSIKQLLIACKEDKK